MKKLILTILAISVTLISIAQRPFATLEHEGTVTAYYGTTALSQAHSAAVAGDIITLSPGMFLASDITKAITLRGAGMFADSAAGTAPTYIQGEFTFSAPEDNNHHLTLEGLYFLNTVKYGTTYSPFISKCFFYAEFTYPSNNATYLRNATVVNCFIQLWRNDRYGYYGSQNQTATGIAFQNCIIANYITQGQETVTNCIINFDPIYCQVVPIINCILYYQSDQHNGGGVSNAVTSWNTIGILKTTNNTASFFHTSMLSPHQLHNYRNFTDVFKQFDGTYYDGMSCELQDSIANTILGNDGTQVGIYGGAHPWNPRVQNYKITVPSESNAAGHLPVTIRPTN